MKKLILILVLAMCCYSTYSQQKLEDLKSKKAIADADINNPQKNKKSKTWMKRSEAYLDIYLMKNIVLGMAPRQDPSKGIIDGVEDIIGKPLSVKTEGVKYQWQYEYADVYFQNNMVAKWVENNPVEPDALAVAFQSIKKSIELDPKTQDLGPTRSILIEIRTRYYNKACNNYVQDLAQQALSDIYQCFEVNKYIKRRANDTFDEVEIKKSFNIE